MDSDKYLTVQIKMKRTEHMSRYFEHSGTDNRVDKIADISAKKQYNSVTPHEENRNCVEALGAGGRRFESCHLDKGITFRAGGSLGFSLLRKSPYCSVSKPTNNQYRVAHFVTHFIRRDDNRVDTVNK